MKSTSKFLALILVVGLSMIVFTTNAHALVWACDWSGGLYSVNTSDASLGFIGNTGLGNLGALEYAPDGTLYGLTYGNGASLYRINPNNAAAALVGSLNFSWAYEGGLVFSPNGTAYGVSYYPPEGAFLFTVDLNTGNGTPGAQLAYSDINGLAWRSDGLMVGLDGRVGSNSLVTIDPITGSMTPLNGLPFETGDVGGMATDFSTGTSYFGTSLLNGSNSLYSFDLFTGAYNSIGQFSGLNDDVGISGLAASSVVPEPGTLMLLGSGLLGLGFFRRRK